MIMCSLNIQPTAKPAKAAKKIKYDFTQMAGEAGDARTAGLKRAISSISDDMRHRSAGDTADRITADAIDIAARLRRAMQAHAALSSPLAVTYDGQGSRRQGRPALSKESGHDGGRAEEA